MTRSISLPSIFNVFFLYKYINKGIFSYNKINEIVLGILKERYRDSIANQLMKEEEEENKSKDASTRNKPKSNKKPISNQQPNINMSSKITKSKNIEIIPIEDIIYKIEETLAEYEEDYFQHFEFYKYFFDFESVAESLVVTGESYERKRRKRKGKKPKIGEATRHGSDATSIDFSTTTASNDVNAKMTELEKEQSDNENQKNKNEEIKKNVELVNEIEIDENETNDLLNEIKIISPISQNSNNKAVSEIIEETPEIQNSGNSSSNSEKPEIKEPKKEQNIPEIKIENEKPAENVVSKSKKKRQRKSKNKAVKNANKKAEIEYEQLKSKALQMFSNLTGASNLQQAKKPNQASKKKKNNKKPDLASKKDSKEKNENRIENHKEKNLNTVENIEEIKKENIVENEEQELDEYGQDWSEEYYDNETGENWQEDLCDPPFEKEKGDRATPSPMVVLSPYVGNLLESVFFDNLTKEINSLVSNAMERNKNVWIIAEKIQTTLQSLVRTVLNGIFFLTI